MKKISFRKFQTLCNSLNQRIHEPNNLRSLQNAHTNVYWPRLVSHRKQYCFETVVDLWFVLYYPEICAKDPMYIFIQHDRIQIVFDPSIYPSVCLRACRYPRLAENWGRNQKVVVYSTFLIGGDKSNFKIGVICPSL